MSKNNDKKELPMDWYLHQQNKKGRSSTLKLEPASELMKMVAMKAPVKSKIKKDFSFSEQKEIQRRMKGMEEQKAVKNKEKSDEAISRRKKIIAIKKKAKEMEKENNSKIILFPSYSRDSDELEWYKMGDFSAMYYVYRMAARMGRSAKIQKDTDKFSKMKMIAAIRGIDKFLALAMNLNEIERHEETADGFHLLYLKKPLTDDEVGILRQTEAIRKEMMHNVLRPKKADAGVYQAILMIDRQVLPKVSNMEKGYYVAVGDKMAQSIHELTTTYFLFADGEIEIEIARKRLLELVVHLMAGTVLLGEVNAWGVDTATAIGENINNLKKIIQEMK